MKRPPQDEFDVQRCEDLEVWGDDLEEGGQVVLGLWIAHEIRRVLNAVSNGEYLFARMRHTYR